MDEEDFGDHGIAPKTLKVKTNYKDEIKTVSLSSQNYIANSFDDLIKPVRNTIGVKMARKMVCNQTRKILTSFTINNFKKGLERRTRRWTQNKKKAS